MGRGRLWRLLATAARTNASHRVRAPTARGSNTLVSPYTRSKHVHGLRIRDAKLAARLVAFAVVRARTWRGVSYKDQDSGDGKATATVWSGVTDSSHAKKELDLIGCLSVDSLPNSGKRTASDSAWGLSDSNVGRM
eukprot:4157043-Prymnesium_polylepis.2